jgi:cell wall-associated NlpC family hydrolase
MISPPPILPKVRPSFRPWTAVKEKILRAKIVAEARSWANTPYVQQGDIKGAGVDCSMLLVRCWVDCGITEPFDPRPYPPNWHMHHSEERYLEWMNTLAVEVTNPQPGDIALFMYGRCYSHGGIMVTPTSLVNASAPHGKVVTSDLTEPWLYYDRNKKMKPRPRKFFDVFARLRQETT